MPIIETGSRVVGFNGKVDEALEDPTPKSVEAGPVRGGGAVKTQLWSDWHNIGGAVHRWHGSAVAEKPRSKTITLSPLAYLHWQFICHAGPTEACAYGVTRATDDTYVERLHIPHQSCSVTYCESDEGQLSEHLLDAEMGVCNQDQIGRVWLHTHPAHSAQPSQIDENTFRDGWHGPHEFYTMMILAEGGQTYCRTRHAGDATSDARTPSQIRVDWAALPALIPQLPALTATWTAEYAEKVKLRDVVGAAAWIEVLPELGRLRPRSVSSVDDEFGPEFANVYDSRYAHKQEKKRRKRRNRSHSDAIGCEQCGQHTLAVGPLFEGVCADCASPAQLQRSGFELVGTTEESHCVFCGDPADGVGSGLSCASCREGYTQPYQVATVEPVVYEPEPRVKCSACDQMCEARAMSAGRICALCDVADESVDGVRLTGEMLKDVRAYVAKTYGDDVAASLTPSSDAYKLYLADYCEHAGIELQSESVTSNPYS